MHFQGIGVSRSLVHETRDRKLSYEESRRALREKGFALQELPAAKREGIYQLVIFGVSLPRSFGFSRLQAVPGQNL